MNDHGEESSICSVHPKEAIVGICAICLKERLLILASKSNNSKKKYFGVFKRKPNITLHKVLALGSFLEFWHRNPGSDSGEDSAASLEDSFISIKFEDDGRASWDHKKGSSNQKQASRMEGKGTKSVVVQTKPRRGAQRWKNRIGYLLQIPGKSHVSSLGKVESRRGWIKSPRRMRATSTTITTKTG
ncbi:hypothetical protein J5N97_022414 [Dioscorea zingiberensis]|uniref:Uncharacterized protein n=1 Tax=Dioscorea zingiberensis TaxID=325984 RepID=A0A9D5CBH6_9LILI|nr:hypothetical protein J5N97_022414 [Dioscorea zingiberensis]